VENIANEKVLMHVSETRTVIVVVDF